MNDKQKDEIGPETFFYGLDENIHSILGIDGLDVARLQYCRCCYTGFKKR